MKTIMTMVDLVMEMMDLVMEMVDSVMEMVDLAGLEITRAMMKVEMVNNSPHPY